MKYRVGAVALLSVPLAISASAATPSLPPIKVSAANQVPACVTPGRLMAFVKSRNDKLDPRFARIAVEYMRHGEQLRMRWDFAFMQMVLETGSLTFSRDAGRRGDVAADQNNFAGLGATGNGEPGERFKDVTTGVLAHLQHVLIYGGERIEDAVAERTRKVQQWGILRAWQKNVRGPITFAHLARRWGNDDAYGAALEGHAKRFFAEFCGKPDPEPGLVAEARSAPVARTEPPAVTGADLARKALADAKGDASVRRSGLGAGLIAKSADPAPAPPAPAPSAPAVVPPTDAPASVAGSAPATAAVTGAAPKAKMKSAPPVQPAALPKAPAAAPSPPPAAAAMPGAECRVWTASYGGSRAIIIRAIDDKIVNYTVLDVNEGQERREAEAYIAAYAKGGMLVEEFTSQALALDKAFELCPEG